MNRLLITGALGHIGSKLIHQIKPNEYDEVVLVDDLSTQRYAALFNLPEGVNFNFIEADILKSNLNELFKDINYVIHLAAITNAAGSFDIQKKVEQVNYEGTKRVADACLVNKAKLIFLSTTSVYGTQEEEVNENCSVEELKPQSPYAESKLKAEKYLEYLGNEKKLNYIILRFGTIYGVSIGMRFHTAINKFVWQACTGSPLTIWSTALNQKRPYLDLQDGINSLNYIIKNNCFDNKIYNVLTNNSTVSDIVENIKIFIPDLAIEYVDSKIMNQLSYTVSCEKFKSLGFQFNGDLNKGISDTIELLKGVKVFQNNTASINNR